MSLTPPAKPGATPRAWVLPSVVVFALIAWLAWRVYQGSFGYNLFSDRDLARAGRFLTDPPFAGAEMSGGSGARVPGPMLGFLMAIPRLVASDAHSTFAWMMALYAASIVTLFVGVGRAFGPLTGAVTAVLFATNATQVSIVDDLWNPALLPLPMTIATVAVVTGVRNRTPAALVVWAAAAAVAAQLHFSALGWAVCTAAAFAYALRGTPKLGKFSLFAALAAFAVYLPYVIDELISHGENTHRMLDQSVGGSKEGGLRVFGPIVVRFMAEYGFGNLGIAGGVPFAAALFGGGAGLVALHQEDGTPARRALGVLAFGAMFTALAVASSGIPHLARRHIAVLAAPISVMSAVGLTMIAHACWTKHRAAGAAALLGMIAVTAVRLPALTGQWPINDFRGYVKVAHRAELAMDAAQIDLATLTSKTAWLTEPNNDEPLYWAGWPAVQHMLDNRALPFPGAGRPPCLLWSLRDAPDTSWTPERVADMLGSRVAITDVRVLLQDDEATLVQYTPDTDRCQTTMVQRYLDMPLEALLRQHWRSIDTGQSIEIPVDEGRLFAVGVPSQAQSNMPNFPAGIHLRQSQGGIDVTLLANQLRGFADNDGWYGVVTVAHPTVTFTPLNGVGFVDMVIHEDVVGGRYAVTPLTVSHALPAGRYKVSLALDVIHIPDDVAPAMEGSQRFTAVVAEDFEVR